MDPLLLECQKSKDQIRALSLTVESDVENEKDNSIDIKSLT